MQEERKQILNMVKEGKITIEEAMALLDELDQTEEAMKKKEEAMIQELAAVVNFDETKKENILSNKKVQSAMAKIFTFIDTTVKRIKDLDLDWNFGKYEGISHIFQTGDGDVREMDIDIANGSVKLASWDQKDIRVECEAKVYRVDWREEARAKFLEEVLFSIERDKMKLISRQRWIKIHTVIYVPRRHYEDVRIRLFNGSIDCGSMNVRNVKAKTANGKILFEKVNSQTAELETVNGSIDVQKGTVEKLEGETTQGSIKLDGFFSNVDAKTLNGSISCTFYNPDGERFEAESLSGSVNLYVPQDTEITGEAKSNLGTIQANRQRIHVLEEKNEVIQKYLKFRPAGESARPLKVKVETKTGGVSIHQTL